MIALARNSLTRSFLFFFDEKLFFLLLLFQFFMFFFFFHSFVVSYFFFFCSKVHKFSHLVSYHKYLRCCFSFLFFFNFSLASVFLAFRLLSAAKTVEEGNFIIFFDNRTFRLKCLRIYGTFVCFLVKKISYSLAIDVREKTFTKLIFLLLF